MKIQGIPRKAKVNELTNDAYPECNRTSIER